MDEVREGLKKQQQASEEKIKNIQTNIAYWERGLKEKEERLREMVLELQKKDK